MYKKEFILVNFIKKRNILSYLEFIHNKYRIGYEKIFVYTIDENPNEYVVTFKIHPERKKIVNEIEGATIFHFKSNCLFSINALNKLLENNGKDKDDELDWSLYYNTVISLNYGEIAIKHINKVIDYNIFFL